LIHVIPSLHIFEQVNLSLHKSTIVLLLFNICTALAPARLFCLCLCLALRLLQGHWLLRDSSKCNPKSILFTSGFSLFHCNQGGLRNARENPQILHSPGSSNVTLRTAPGKRHQARMTSPIISIARRHPRSRLFSQPAKRIFTRAAGFYIASLLSSSEGSIGRQEFELEPHPCLFFDYCLPFHCLLFTAAAQEPAAFSFFLLPENQRRSRFWTRGFLLPRSRGSKKGT